MNTHPYLRAYMAGSVIPTAFMLIVITGFVLLRYGFQIAIPIERGMVFPIAFVPNLWGIWNVLYVSRKIHHHPTTIGLHGAILPFVLGPLALLVGKSLGLVQLAPQGFFYLQLVSLPYVLVALGFCCGLIIYYLVWKYMVGFLNEVLGIA